MSLLGINSLDILFRTSTKPIKVVSGLSFNINESEVFGLVGESGCGKSLTALAVMGILPPNAYAEGVINFKGTDLLKLNREPMRRLRGKELAMIFQEPMTSLNPVLTIGYQIAEVMTTHLGLSKKEASNRAVELLRDVKIPS
ncbi:MAG: peptide ABC transporter ATP-binding protein, partial [Nitrospirae bacterium CG22_combo_CG10-13_8_21_14_all_44_11]